MLINYLSQENYEFVMKKRLSRAITWHIVVFATITVSVLAAS